MKLENQRHFEILPLLKIDLFCDFLPMVKFWSHKKNTLYKAVGWVQVFRNFIKIRLNFQDVTVAMKKYGFSITWL